MTYVSEVLADTPVHWWRCADPGGRLLYDLGSSKHHLRLVGDQAGYSGPVVGGGSFYCDGVNGASTADNLGDTGGLAALWTSPFTAELWVWLAFHRGVRANFLAFDNVTANSFVVSIGSDRKLLAGTSSCAAVIDPTARSTQRWYHVVFVCDGATYKIYVDGALANTAACAAAFSAARHLGVGGDPTTGNNMTMGFFSEVALYSSALSLARIAAHHAAADATAQQPVFHAPAVFLQSVGGVQPIGSATADLDSIYNAVHRSY